MNDELIDDATLDALPEEPGHAFVLFERACRASYRAATAQEESAHAIEGYQLDFMHDVIAAAQHYDIPGVKDFRLPPGRNYPWEIWEEFNRKVRFFTTHYRLASKTLRTRESVELIGDHKDRIRTLVAHIKAAIDKADMPDWRKNRLRKHIADFEVALDGKRLNFVTAMKFLAALGAGVHGMGAGADGVAKLVHEITVLVGQSKELEDDNRPQLSAPEIVAPVYRLEHQETPARFGREEPTFQRDEVDDEIPF